MTDNEQIKHNLLLNIKRLEGILERIDKFCHNYDQEKVDASVAVLKIKSAIENYIPSNNRSEIIETNNNKVILDAYNANPTSIKAALKSFVEYKTDHKTIILGDMFELGEFSSIEHQKVVDFVSSANFDSVFFVGSNFSKTTSNHLKFKTLEALEKYLLNKPIKNSTILIKGSRGVALEKIVPYC